jgi:sialic acid synthase SpsE
MSRCLLVAELATSHHGDVGLAEAMIAQAAEAGADQVKIQSFSKERINPNDPQALWLRESWLDEGQTRRLWRCAEQQRVELTSTPFDAKAKAMLDSIGIPTKIASTESGRDWWRTTPFPKVVSYPWSIEPLAGYSWLKLRTIPLYPTPLECVGQVPLLDGLSDHCVGVDACFYAIANGAKMVEVHMCLPGRSRVMPFDKTPEQIKQIREFAEAIATIKTGVSRVFRDRWTA